MKNKHCQWCDKQFETKISYQIYCSSECRDLATREKIADRYYTTKVKKRKGKQRPCKACGLQLSIYNDEQLCQTCLVNPLDVKKTLNEIKKLGKDGP
jgi:predicted nucleic acid-binding Zn ribbon protein